MIEYKNDLRIRVHASRGTTSLPDLTSDAGYESPLDKEIILCASKCLKGQKLTTFFFAYHCLKSWSDIQMKFATHLKREVDLETVQRYARDAANRILDSIKKS